jgi:hypothetical protein
MSGGKVAYEEEVIEVLKREDVAELKENSEEQRQFNGLRRADSRKKALSLKDTYFVGPTGQAKYSYIGEMPPPGVLPPWPEDSLGPSLSASLNLDDPNVGSYTFEIKRTLWSLGRGYSKFITDIEDVVVQENGLISVNAEGLTISRRPGARWQLTIDPSAAYMVRSAKMYRVRNDKLYVSIVNSGTKWVGARCIPERSEYKDYFGGERIIASESRSASSQADMEFLKRAEAVMRPPYPLHTNVMDERMNRESVLQYNADELFPKGRTIVVHQSPQQAKPQSLVGKKIPTFEGIKIDFELERAKGRSLLLCFFDFEQRPSRNCILLLSKKADELKPKDVVIVAIHPLKVKQTVFDEWVKKNNIPFPVGMVEGDEEKTRFNWGVRSLPWLILTDKQNIVRAEGFGVNELDEKITTLKEK